MAKPFHQLLTSTRSRTSLVVLSAFIAVASIAGVMAQALGPAGPSPATGAASVIAQGVYAVPDEDQVWQVSTFTAESGMEPVEIPSPAFVLARTTPLLIVDEGTGIRERIANGEAAYLNPGQTVRLETFGPPDDFIVIELTPRNASSMGAEPLIGQPFRPLMGERDLDLVRDVLNEGEQSEIPGGAGRTLVLGLTGQVTATTGDDAAVAISAGDIAEFEGPITFTGVTDGSEFVAAYIGSAIGFGEETIGTPAAVQATPATTEEPPTAPTEVPTEAPTQAATEAPTQVPTDVPTEAPTEEPTEEPTVAPTEAPPEDPTQAPADATEEPAVEATEEPAAAPTEGGTEAPAEVSTEAATEEPAPAATAVATEEPAGTATTAASGDGPPFALEVVTGDSGADADGDALTDAQEAFYDTDPAIADTDTDGINDHNELVEYGTDPVNADSDEDGINDFNEVFVYETDPLNLDSDGDLLYDGGELVYNVDPLDRDTDRDGLTDGEEVYFALTDPAEADTDGDGINDSNEVINGSDPLDPNSPGSNAAESPGARVDTDGDGLTDPQEARYGTDRFDGDTDGDGVNDSNEIAAGTDPLDINSWPR